MHYDLYYWPGIQGRGEFVRLALEDAGADYNDAVRERGTEPLQPFLDGRENGLAPFAPPFLKAGDLVIAQTALILDYLGLPLDLVPGGEAARLNALQLQLTITDVVAEIHDCHHPVASSLYFKDQKEEAIRSSRHLREERLPKFLGYFEGVLQRTGGTGILGRHSYVDLSLFQLVSGLEYAFPRAMQKLGPDIPGLLALRDRTAARPNVAAYLASDRRLAFNTDGIFRHYPELDG